MSRTTATRLVSAALVVSLAVTAWVFLAPPRLGGDMRYAIITGSSMEPVLTGGDLAVIRSGGAPQVGDVVLYRDPGLGVDVLHRIVRQEGGRFVLKGDANDFLDDARLSPSEIEGSLWITVPHAGAALAWLHVPLFAALFVFVLTAIALSGGSKRQASPSEA